MLSVEAWVGVIGLILTVVGAIIRMEQRMGKALTREEHERICQDRNTRVERQLDGLRADMEKRHTENCDKFERIEEGITGTHRRLDDLYRDLINPRGTR